MSSNVTASKASKPSNVLPQLTDADMIVFNDHPKPITFVTDNNNNMSSKFPSPVTIAAGASVRGSIKAGNWPSQSYFDVHFPSNEVVHIKIGTGIYSTSATPDVLRSAQGAVVLAPGPPFTTDTDYTFWFFNGPNLVSQMINSAIQANLPAILSYINAHSLTIPLTDGVSITLDQVKVDPASVQCVYAAALPKTGGSGTAWQLNAVIRVGNGSLAGLETIKGQMGTLKLSVTDLKLYLQATVDFSSPTTPLEVTALQMSLGDYTLGGTIVAILKTMFPLVAQLFALGASAYRVAGFINNTVNGDIITAINDAIKNLFKAPKLPLILPPSIPTAGMRFVSSLLSSPHTNLTRLSTLSWLGNPPSTWMSTAAIQAKTLGQIKLPGTHDSATYNLSSTLSQIQYPDIAFLWNLNAGVAPANGNWPITIPPSPTSPLYVGQALQDFILGSAINSISRTHDLDIHGQLRAGIRYFDFRVYFDTRDSNFYIQHALRGPTFSDVLSQIAQFLKENATSGELIFAYVSHTNFKDNPGQQQPFADLINKFIPASNLYYQATPSGQQSFDFQTLANTTLSSITKGAPKVMFLNGDWSEFTFKNTLTNTDGFAGVPWSGERYTVGEMSQQEAAGLASNTQPLYSIGWSLGADTPTIIQTILTLLTGVNQFALQDLATKANTALPGFIEQNGGAGAKFNLVSVDWLEYGSNPSVPDYIIALNN